MTQRKQIAIIGGGPAGLIAAEIIARSGHPVTIYDRMASVGRKFLLAGRGGLNLTHSEPLERFTHRYGAGTQWLAPAINSFTPENLRAWAEGLGQELFVGSSGRVFPRSMKAAPLLRAWLQRLNETGVQFAMRHTWQGFEGGALRFTDAEGKDVIVTPDATLLALGGASWPRLGSDGGWATILQEANVDITPLKPTNCGFVVPWSEHFKTKFAGNALKPVTLEHNGLSQQGEAMITAHGIEGGVVYALSAALRNTIQAKNTALLRLDLRPGMEVEALAKKLDLPRGSQSLGTYLRKCGLSPLIIGLLRETMSAEQLAQASPQKLAAQLKAITLTLTDTAPITRAISTAGGIKREALNDNFMLKNLPGVFVAGEMLDWEAPTGGYLLQGCFSTAAAAAEGILRYSEEA